MDIRKFAWEQLPPYFKANDTYKDEQGRGLLQRYLDTLGEELQEETVKKLLNLINYLDPTRNPENNRVFTRDYQKPFGLGVGVFTNQFDDNVFGTPSAGTIENYIEVFTEPFNEVFGSDEPIYVEGEISEWLTLLAYTVASPPYIIQNEETYRKQVSQAINLYKYRGTKKGFEMLLNLIGFRLKEVYVHTPPNYYYDSGITYDQQGVRYDLTKCNTHCVEYNLIYQAIDEDGYPLNKDQVIKLANYIISDFQPINAKLRHLIFYNGVDGVFTIEFTNEYL